VNATSTHHTPVDPTHAAPYPLIRSVYFTAPNPFPALEAFVIDSTTRYAMDLYRFGGGMKAALAEYLECAGGKNIRAILLGTRQGDPNGSELLILCPGFTANLQMFLYLRRQIHHGRRSFASTLFLTGRMTRSGTSCGNWTFRTASCTTKGE
jgi:hypothetical protein